MMIAKRLATLRESILASKDNAMKSFVNILGDSIDS